MTSGFTTDETARAARRLQELGEKIDNAEQLITALAAAWVSTYTRFEWTAAQQIAEQQMEIAQRSGSHRGLTAAHMHQGTSLQFRGPLTEAMQHFEATIALYNETDWSGNIMQPHIVALGRLGDVLWHLGSADQGRAKIRESISLAERSENPASMLLPLTFALTFYMDLREPGNVQEVAERLSTLASEQQVPSFVGSGTVFRGWAMAEQGRTEEGIATDSRRTRFLGDARAKSAPGNV